MIHWSQILQTWKCTSSELTCREWVCRSVCRPSALSTGSSAALLGPLASLSLTKPCTNLLSDCLKMLKMFPHGSRKYSAHPAGARWASRFLLSWLVGNKSESTERPSVPRATKRARLGLSNTCRRRWRSESRDWKQLLGEEWRHLAGSLLPVAGELGGGAWGCCRSISPSPPPRSREAKNPPSTALQQLTPGTILGKTFKLGLSFNQSCMILGKEGKRIGNTLSMDHFGFSRWDCISQHLFHLKMSVKNRNKAPLVITLTHTI